ncbi:MAG TPA: ketoacyl-ACP synthase III [Candidatus Binatia bacterium]|jgi:3-oxoacyl-[acyl-carrier-protein] synthase-3
MLTVCGMGHAHPASEISNRFLEDLDIGTDEAWILERTGIRSRRTVLDLDYIRTTRNADIRAAREATLESNAVLAARAARMALVNAGIDAAGVGLVIGVGSAPDHVTPAEACIVAAELGIEVPAIDVRSACTSFGAALHLLAGMRDDALPEHVLVVAPETVTRTVDYADRTAAVLWGDAAAAAVVSRDPARPGARIVSTSLDSRPSGYASVVVPWADYFAQHGSVVQSFAIRTSVRLWKDLNTRTGGDAGNGSTTGEAMHYIGHQANLLMLENVARSCGIAAEHHHFNVDRFGNTASAGSASVLSEHWRSFGAGERVALIGVGAGLTWSATLLQFAQAAQ